jgi:hypothetical protein
MHVLKPLVAVAAFALLAAPAVSQTNTMNSMHNAMSGNSLNIVLGQQNKSGETGSATVTNVPGGIKVDIALKGEMSGASEPAHIHQGTCAKLNPAPYKPLSNVINGRSTTIVKGMSVADVKKGRYAINVHKSAAQLTHYVSCGDL